MNYVEGKLNGIPTVSELMDEVKKCEEGLDSKLGKDNLVAGNNITIEKDKDNLIISSTASTNYEAGDGLSLNNNIFSIDETIVATTSELQGKQNVIEDLAEIRSGALKGATAVQPETGKSLFSGNYEDLTNTPDLSIYATKDTKVAGVSLEQDTENLQQYIYDTVIEKTVADLENGTEYTLPTTYNLDEINMPEGEIILYEDIENKFGIGTFNNGNFKVIWISSMDASPYYTSESNEWVISTRSTKGNTREAIALPGGVEPYTDPIIFTYNEEYLVDERYKDLLATIAGVEPVIVEVNRTLKEKNEDIANWNYEKFFKINYNPSDTISQLKTLVELDEETTIYRDDTVEITFRYDEIMNNFYWYFEDNIYVYSTTSKIPWRNDNGWITSQEALPQVTLQDKYIVQGFEEIIPLLLYTEYITVDDKFNEPVTDKIYSKYGGFKDIPDWEIIETLQMPINVYDNYDTGENIYIDTANWEQSEYVVAYSKNKNQYTIRNYDDGEIIKNNWYLYNYETDKYIIQKPEAIQINEQSINSNYKQMFSAVYEEDITLKQTIDTLENEELKNKVYESTKHPDYRQFKDSYNWQDFWNLNSGDNLIYSTNNSYPQIIINIIHQGVKPLAENESDGQLRGPVPIIVGGTTVTITYEINENESYYINSDEEIWTYENLISGEYTQDKPEAFLFDSNNVVDSETFNKVCEIYNDVITLKQKFETVEQEIKEQCVTKDTLVGGISLQNSTDGLDNYIITTGRGFLPTIDWSKFSSIVSRGVEPYGPQGGGMVNPYPCIDIYPNGTNRYYIWVAKSNSNFWIIANYDEFKNGLKANTWYHYPQGYSKPYIEEMPTNFEIYEERINYNYFDYLLDVYSYTEGYNPIILKNRINQIECPYSITDYTDDGENLTSIVLRNKLNGTEAMYNIGGGKQLYQHNITLFKNDQQTQLCITIINGVPNAYTTISGVANWLKDKNYTNTTKNYNCNGVGYYNSTFKCYYGCYYILNLSVDSIRAFYYANDGSASYNTWSDNTSDLEITDTVIAL